MSIIATKDLHQKIGEQYQKVTQLNTLLLSFEEHNKTPSANINQQIELINKMIYQNREKGNNLSDQYNAPNYEKPKFENNQAEQEQYEQEQREQEQYETKIQQLQNILDQLNQNRQLATNELKSKYVEAQVIQEPQFENTEQPPDPAKKLHQYEQQTGADLELPRQVLDGLNIPVEDWERFKGA